MRLRPLIVAASALLVACSGGGNGSASTTSSVTSTSQPQPTIDDHALLLGAVLPRGGPVPDLGVSMRAAVDLAVKEINAAGGVLGQPIRVITSDEGESPATALLAVQGLMAQGVDAIIGPASSIDILSTLAATTQKGVLTCSPTASALSLDGFPGRGLFFRTVPSDSLQAAAIARTVENSGSTGAAVAYLDDAYGRPFLKATERSLRARNLNVSPAVAFSATDASIAAAVTSITAAKPSVVVVLADATSGPALIRAIDAGTAGSKPLYVVNDAMRRPDASAPPFAEALGNRVRGVSPLAYPATASFLAALQQVNPAAQGLYAVNAYDCVNLIALAAQASGATLGTTIAAAIPGVSSVGSGCADFVSCDEVLRDGRNPDYNGPDGVISIDDKGNPSVAKFELFSYDASGRDVGLGSLTIGAG